MPSVIPSVESGSREGYKIAGPCWYVLNYVA